MELTRIDTVVQFTPGTPTAWNNVSVPVPSGAVIIDTVNKIIKEGNGTSLFADLPVCLDYNFNSSTSGAITPEGDQVGNIAISDDSLYAASTSKLIDILNGLTVKNTKSATQQDRINTLTTANLVSAISESAVDGTLIICNNGKYEASNRTLAQLISDIVAYANAVNANMHIADLVWYSDSGLTNPIVTPNEVTEQNTYWVKVSGFHDSAEITSVDFGLATATPGITITSDKAEETCAILATIYGTANIETFNMFAIDSNENIFCIGRTGATDTTVNMFICKFDSSLNLQMSKTFSALYENSSVGIVIDKNDKIFITFRSKAVGGAIGVQFNTVVVKLDNSLNLILTKIFKLTTENQLSTIAVDNFNNILLAGSVSVDLQQGLIVKLDNNLNILAQQYLGGVTFSHINKIVVDSINNIFVCGATNFNDWVTQHAALIIKFDSNLNLIANKAYYGPAGYSLFVGMVCDSNDNIAVTGYTTAEGLGGDEALIIKFDNNLNILAKKRFGGSGSDTGNSIRCDYDNNFYVVGQTASEGAGGFDASVVKFDNNLNLLSKKRYSGSSADSFSSVDLINDNSLIITGYTASEGAGNKDALVIKIPTSIPSGSFTGSVLTALTLTDITTLTLAESNLTYATSINTFTTSDFAISDTSEFKLTNFTGTVERDVIVAARYAEPTKLTTAIYTSSAEDNFSALTTDLLGNTIAVGYTTIDGKPNGLIVKFDSNFVVIARKIYSGNYSEQFTSVVTDASNNIICVGYFNTSSGGLNEAFIVKFDSSLTSIIIQKTYGATGDDVLSDICLDPSGNLICVGYTTSEGSGGSDALIIKFSPTFTILAKKRYGGASEDKLLSVAIDSLGNAICVGHTYSEGANGSGLILKLDSNLNIVLRKIYNSTLGSLTRFRAVTVTAANVIYCCGNVVIGSGSKGLVVKFDSNLNTTGNKIYGIGNSTTTIFSGIDLDSAGNVFCVGKTDAEGAGNSDALAVKFSSVLAIKNRKTYGSIGNDADIDGIVNNNDDLIISGYSVINGSTDAVVTKLPGTLPAGVYTNKYFTELILSDSKLTLSDDIGTVSNSVLAMLDSSLTLTNGSMSINNASGAVVTDNTIMDAVGNVFKITIGDIIANNGSSIAPEFNVTTNDGDKQVNKTISTIVNKFSIIASVYGGTGDDYLAAADIDYLGNIVIVGRSTSESFGGIDAIIVKFDSNFNILAKKRYGGTGNDIFSSVKCDATGNIFVVGYTSSEGAGNNDALIIKFDKDLNILVGRYFGGTGIDSFRKIAIDKSGNIVVVGASYSNTISGVSGNATDALVYKFDNNLVILAQKRFGGIITGGTVFHSVATDSLNNIYCVGYLKDDVAIYVDGLIVKFDSNLNVLAKKRYGGSKDEQLLSVAVDSNDNVFCCGYTISEGVSVLTYPSALLLKFDKDLSLIKGVVVGGTNEDIFYFVSINNDNDVICVGYTISEGFGNLDALITKFDNDLNIISKKIYGGTGNDSFVNSVIDNNDNTIAIGSTVSEGAGNADGIFVKFPATIPSGTFTGDTLTSITLKESNLALSASALALVDTTNINTAVDTLTSGNLTTLVLVNSTLSQETNVISI